MARANRQARMKEGSTGASPRRKSASLGRSSPKQASKSEWQSMSAGAHDAEWFIECYRTHRDVLNDVRAQLDSEIRRSLWKYLAARRSRWASAALCTSTGLVAVRCSNPCAKARRGRVAIPLAVMRYRSRSSLCSP